MKRLPTFVLAIVAIVLVRSAATACGAYPPRSSEWCHNVSDNPAYTQEQDVTIFQTADGAVRDAVAKHAVFALACAFKSPADKDYSATWEAKQAVLYYCQYLAVPIWDKNVGSMSPDVIQSTNAAMEWACGTDWYFTPGRAPA